MAANFQSKVLVLEKPPPIEDLKDVFVDPVAAVSYGFVSLMSLSKSLG